MVPRISPSWLRHGIRVYYSGMGQSRLYDIPYSHIATYASIALPKGTFWSPTAVTLWYHHISTFQLCHNDNAIWLRLTYTYPYMSTLLCNVMVPRIKSFRLYHGTLVSYFQCYSGMPQPHQYAPLQCNIMVFLTPVHLGYAMVPRYLTLVWLILAYTPHHTPTDQSTCPLPYLKTRYWAHTRTLWYHHISFMPEWYSGVTQSHQYTPSMSFLCHIYI